MILKGKVKLRRFVGFAMAQDGSRFARIVIAVVEEENDLAADFPLQSPRRSGFWRRKRFGKNPQGCWPKQMIGAVMSRAFYLFGRIAQESLQNDA